jgi:hypothetical protein
MAWARDTDWADFFEAYRAELKGRVMSPAAFTGFVNCKMEANNLYNAAIQKTRDSQPMATGKNRVRPSNKRCEKYSV